MPVSSLPVGRGVAVLVGLGVAVLVGVDVAVLVGVGVAALVGVDVAVGADVGAGVDVGDARHAVKVSTSTTADNNITSLFIGLAPFGEAHAAKQAPRAEEARSTSFLKG
jgi:hypothetical protein